MASSKLRNSCSLSNLLLSCLNFTLFIISLTSITPIILLKTPPSIFGFVFLIVSALSLLSSFLGFFSLLSRPCFLAHFSLLLAAILGQLFAFLSLFCKEKKSISLFKSPRDPREAKLLVRVECGFFIIMLVLQVFVTVMTWTVRSCWVREYKGFEEAVDKKRGDRITRVYEESMGNSEKSKEVKDMEFDEKMKKKYGQWVKTDFEG